VLPRSLYCPIESQAGHPSAVSAPPCLEIQCRACHPHSGAVFREQFLSLNHGPAHELVDFREMSVWRQPPGITTNVGKAFLHDPEDRGFISVESRPRSTDTSSYIWILLRSEDCPRNGQAHFVTQWGMREMGNRAGLAADCSIRRVLSATALAPARSS
jgi:hypothetical protein